MKIFLAGVRGSMPCPGPEFLEFGGHTTCLVVMGDGGERILLDAGSGVQLANPLLKDLPTGELTILMTHLHLDHLLGFPTLEAIYRPGVRVGVHAGSVSAQDLEGAVRRVASPPLWPLPLENMGADLQFHRLSGELKLGGLTVRCAPVPHPGGCCAYRIEEAASGRSLVFATDLEWNLVEEGQNDLLALCREPRPADLLIMEGHFSAEQLPGFRGWGHSSVDQCAQAAREIGVGRLVVTHHNPDHPDPVLLDLEAHLDNLLAGALLARQGTTLTL
jgi:ribonuclease BN (tRNA processing enzyme)